MSIEFQNVTKRVRKGAIRANYQSLDIRIGDRESVALLGHSDAGVDGILDLICHADAPDAGRVVRTSSISWPIPNAKFLHRHLSLAANARFIARLYGAEERDFLKRVAQLAAAGDAVNLRVDRCPAEILSRFVFCLGVCLPFDHYILTKTSAGGRGDRDRFQSIIDDIRNRASVLLVGKDAKGAQRFCDSAYVFDGAQVTFYTDVEAAGEHLKELASKVEGVEAEDDESDSELRDLVNLDF